MRRILVIAAICLLLLPAGCALPAGESTQGEVNEMTSMEEEPELKLVYMANLSVPACVVAIRRAGKEGRVRVLAHDNGPDIRRLLREGAVDFTIGQDLSYQSYQALTLLFRAVAEHKMPERDCYYSASPILNAETI